MIGKSGSQHIQQEMVMINERRCIVASKLWSRYYRDKFQVYWENWQNTKYNVPLLAVNLGIRGEQWRHIELQ